LAEGFGCLPSSGSVTGSPRRAIRSCSIVAEGYSLGVELCPCGFSVDTAEGVLEGLVWSWQEMHCRGGRTLSSTTWMRAEVPGSRIHDARRKLYASRARFLDLLWISKGQPAVTSPAGGGDCVIWLSPRSLDPLLPVHHNTPAPTHYRYLLHFLSPLHALRWRLSRHVFCSPYLPCLPFPSQYIYTPSCPPHT
jgi:hypothetical protein